MTLQDQGEQELLEMKRERDSCIRPQPCLRISLTRSFAEASSFPFAPSLSWVFVTCSSKNSSYTSVILVTIGTGNSKSIELCTRCPDIHLVTGAEAVVSRLILEIIGILIKNE